eukprot:m.275308 g.275308  ORF g.275308 m.275308 type:complete len:597 (-) comp16293_c0_seq14:4624-6414(-)
MALFNRRNRSTVITVVVLLFVLALVFTPMSSEDGGIPVRSVRGMIDKLEAEVSTEYFTLIDVNDHVEKRPVIRLKGPATPKQLHGPVGIFSNGTPGWQAVPMPERSESFEEKRRAHKPNCFNLRRSNSLPLDRDVPDVRHPKCKEIKYPKDLPETSVVFVFINEPLSPLLRSIISVLNRTPPHLLKEIILVDDGSDADFSKGPLEDFLRLLPKVTLKRCPTRRGLMAARTEGAKHAKASVVTFLDSHIEVNEGWLEPLLARIHEDRKHVVMPIIDSIEPDNFQYMAGGLDIVAFNWALGQDGVSRKMEDTAPMSSPAMAGGLFSIDRDRFFELGAYDPEMKLYGSEQMEISLRLWMCGSTLECIPCSRVGHIFRTSKYWQGQVYRVPGEVILRNTLRAAKIWMPDYFHLVERANSRLPRGVTIGDISWGEEIKERLKCKDMKWFLKNVFPELFVPEDPAYVLHSGALKNEASGGCLDNLGHSGNGDAIGLYACHGGATQDMALSRRNELRIAGSGHSYEMCVDRGSADGLSMYHCHGGGGNQYWAYDERTGHLYSEDKRCLEAIKAADGSLSLKMSGCDDNKATQSWNFEAIHVQN